MTARASGAEVAWDAELDPPPVGQWVIGIWFVVGVIAIDPPETGTVRLLSDGTWEDEAGDPVGSTIPSHWIPLPRSS